MRTVAVQTVIISPRAPMRPRLNAASSAVAAAASAVLLLTSCAVTQNNHDHTQPPSNQTINPSPALSPAPPGIEAPGAPTQSLPPNTPASPSETASPADPPPDRLLPPSPPPAAPSPGASASGDSLSDKPPSLLDEPPEKVSFFKRSPDSPLPPKNKAAKSEALPQKIPKQIQPRKIRDSVPDERLQLPFDSAPVTPSLSEPPVPVPINPLKEPDIPLDSFTPSSHSPAPLEDDPPAPPLVVGGKTAAQPSVSPPQKPPSSPVHPALSAETPLRYLDAPGTFTVTLRGQGWVFRSDLADPGPWVYLEREREGDSTRFHFRVDEEGAWNLVFDRQDLKGGGIERNVRRVKAGGSQAPPAEPNETPTSRFVNARKAAEAGRFQEAFAIWEEDAGRSGSEGRGAREGIVREASRLGAMAPLVRWLNPYIEDGADPLVLQNVLERLTGTLGYREQTIAVLEALLSGERRDEWLYRLAFLLEQPGDYRDIDRAAQLYRELVASRTLSIWRDRAEKRISRLERHYYRVR